VLGDVDAESAPRLAAQLCAEIDRATDRVVVADCSGVTFMGSAGFRLLLDASAYATARGHTLTIHNMSRSCKRLLALCDSSNRLSIHA
jgi:anti-anti-sigma factor